ncbi:ABC transporter ATP-binding protein [Bombiscardovia nodaiensis]|uniref:ABC transporter ATP-binding protein n=1 Tax=Bombiscardovia nodaiensis TaxID=2932181 RepID=A0ABM8B7E1_9BIFI|nr:ABC transporter ATP-binding protein [Bombiscardovia nodaiensis]
MDTAVEHAVPLMLSGVSYHYEADGPGIDDVSLSCSEGSWTAVMGPSGAGKSTLLYCASGLLPVSSGSVCVGGQELTAMNEQKLTRLRRDHIGFIFQDYNLVEAFSCLQNVMLSDLFGGRRIELSQALAALAQVGLEESANLFPGHLSGGQRQRVAIARALAAQPDMIFADEPTGALDSKSSRMVLTSLRAVVNEGRAVLMVTHDPSVAAEADRVIFVEDGRVRSVLPGGDPHMIAQELTALAHSPEEDRL